jgi:hypothetical protein
VHDLLHDLAAHLVGFVRPCLSTDLTSNLHTECSELLRAVLGRILRRACAALPSLPAPRNQLTAELGVRTGGQKVRLRLSCYSLL